MDNTNYRSQIEVEKGKLDFFDITRLEKNGIAEIHRLPYSIKILVENLLRKLDGHVVLEEDLKNIARWQKSYDTPVEIPYHPARVLMQDFT
ncbi:MAG: aconitate hydratase, partial [Desulfobacterales bacterium]